ncbi:MAG: terminase small subunit, partial [Magnetococcus sp. YQC-5]
KQARFVEEYLVDLNATQAAVRAGYSAKTAKQVGYENLTKPHLQSAIQNYQKQLAAEAGVTPEKIVKELTKLAFLEIKDLFDHDWNLKNASQVPEHVKAAITSVSKSTTPAGISTVKVTLTNKLGAIDLLGRVLGIFNQDKNKDNESKDIERIEIIKAGRKKHET